MEITCEANEFLALNMPDEDWKPSLSKCCIYRVPHAQRRVNPGAYTPQMVLIGPLHHAKKRQALKLIEMECASADMETIESRYKSYLEMEKQKRVYYNAFCERVEMEGTGFRSIIESNEKKIRSCYAESTISISSAEFVNMILVDALFIIEFLLRQYISEEYEDDILMSRPCLLDTVWYDLILFENQLPYFVLEDLCDLVSPKIFPTKGRYSSFRDITFDYFGSRHVMEEVEFKHFTDLIRYTKIRTLKLKHNRRDRIMHVYNAEKLHEAGVHFSILENEDDSSINVSFEKKCFKMARFTVYDNTELELRNIMALEQCQYPHEAYVCYYVVLLDYLINTEKDVELLVHKGIIENCIGDHKLVADMVNKLSYGIVADPSCYYDIAQKLNEYHNKFWNRNVANLKYDYFNNVWKATATFAAAILLLLTLGQMITSVIQVKQGQGN